MVSAGILTAVSSWTIPSTAGGTGCARARTGYALMASTCLFLSGECGLNPAITCAGMETVLLPFQHHGTMSLWVLHRRTMRPRRRSGLRLPQEVICAQHVRRSPTMTCRSAEGHKHFRGNERWGEAVKAIVVLRPGMQASAEELINHCHARIAGYKLLLTA